MNQTSLNQSRHMFRGSFSIEQAFEMMMELNEEAYLKFDIDLQNMIDHDNLYEVLNRA